MKMKYKFLKGKHLCFGYNSGCDGINEFTLNGWCVNLCHFCCEDLVAFFNSKAKDTTLIDV